MAYKYLNEPIFVTFTFPQNYAGRNLNYSVLDGSSGVVLYNGSVYVTGKEQKLYLNDIVNQLCDDQSWFRNIDLTTSKTIDSAIFTIDLIIRFGGVSADYQITDIMLVNPLTNITPITTQATTRASSPEGGGPITPPDVHPVGMNVTPTVTMGNNVTPHIPYMAIAENKFFAGYTILHSKDIANEDYFLHISMRDENMNPKGSMASYQLEPNHTVTRLTLCSPDLYKLTYVNGVKYIGINATTRGTEGKVVKIAEVDHEPAEYYISWINRYGAWQCQPLCAKNQMSETVETQTITTINNEIIPVTKHNELSWTLNTHWLTYDEHNEFESVLQSKYVYLYNTRTNDGQYVNVKDSYWAFKNSNNTKRPFNLTLKLTKSTKQIINI